MVRYIHLNCVRAGLAEEPSEWLWSSHRIYLGLEKNPLVPEKDVLKFFENRDINVARRKYAEFVREGLNKKSSKEIYPPERFPVLGDEKFLDTIGKGKKELRRRDEISLRVSLSDLIKVVENITSAKRDEIIGSSETRECSFARDIFSLIARNYCKQKVSTIARFLHRSVSTITMSLRRTKNRLQTNDGYKQAITKSIEKIKGINN